MSDSWKEKIRAGVLAQRLYSHANGNIEMTSSQIKAADILLKKLVPDLGRTEVVGDKDNPLNMNLNVNFVAPNGKPS